MGRICCLPPLSGLGLAAFFFLLLTAALALVASAAPSEDRVTSLPDFNETLPSAHYSGYLTALNESYLHYYAVEAIEADPATAPVILWMNGGPGCSSMDGWGYELGPFHFKNYGDSGPIFTLNNFTWARLANLVFLEAPPGVGFSYRDDGKYAIDDTENARNNHAAMVYFFQKKFPEWSSNKFFIAGESYGGIYVPTLAQEVLEHPDHLTNFAGIMVGDGVTDQNADSWISGGITFDYTHGLITSDIYQSILGNCPHSKSPGAGIHQQDVLLGHGHIDDNCTAAVVAYFTMTSDLNLYNAYGYCFEQPRHGWKYIPILRARLEFRAKMEGSSVDAIIDRYAREENERVQELLSEMVPAGRRTSSTDGKKEKRGQPKTGVVPCIDSAVMAAYLNRKDVQEALHVRTDMNLTWALCYDFPYSSNVVSVVPVWKNLIAMKYPVLFYSGNVDRCVPYTGTKAWIENGGFNRTTPTEPWAFHDVKYPYGPQAGGLHTKYDDYFTFITVNGAGHMVPQYRPAAAYAMFSTYMAEIGATTIKAP